MKKTIYIVLTVLFTMVLLYTNLFAMDARAIMVKVDNRNDGDNATSNMEMILIDKSNSKRIRKIKIFRKDKGNDTRKLMFFLYPSDVKGTGFLTYDYDNSDKDDDQWLYLPALRKTKRIASSDKSSSFMGSDYTYSDMTSRDVDDYKYKLLKETKVKGNKCWIIMAIPNNKKIIEETGYKKSIFFVRQDNFFVIRAKHWLVDGGYVKYGQVVGLKKISGIWVATETQMVKKRGKKTVHKTILKYKNIKFNQDLKSSMFSVRKLEKGI